MPYIIEIIYQPGTDFEDSSYIDKQKKSCASIRNAHQYRTLHSALKSAEALNRRFDDVDAIFHIHELEYKTGECAAILHPRMSKS